MTKNSADRRREMRKAKQPKGTLVVQANLPRDISLPGVPLQNVQTWLQYKVPTDILALPRKPDDDAFAKLQKTIPGIATNAWRAKRKILNVETGEPKEDMNQQDIRRVYRHVEAIMEALAEVGIEIVDQRGQAYDTGMALRVVSSEEREGLKREEIVETLKPTIRSRGRVLQLGEVVLGIPKSRPSPATTETPPIVAKPDQERQ